MRVCGGSSAAGGILCLGRHGVVVLCVVLELEGFSNFGFEKNIPAQDVLEIGTLRCAGSGTDGSRSLIPREEVVPGGCRGCAAAEGIDDLLCVPSCVFFLSTITINRRMREIVSFIISRWSLISANKRRPMYLSVSRRIAATPGRRFGCWPCIQDTARVRCAVLCYCRDVLCRGKFGTGCRQEQVLEPRFQGEDKRSEVNKLVSYSICVVDLVCLRKRLYWLS